MLWIEAPCLSVVVCGDCNLEGFNFAGDRQYCTMLPGWGQCPPPVALALDSFPTNTPQVFPIPPDELLLLHNKIIPCTHCRRLQRYPTWTLAPSHAHPAMFCVHSMGDAAEQLQ